MKLTDFLGKEYGPGDLVIYGAMSGRCVNMVIGRVVDIYEVYRDRDSFKWVKMADGELPPFKTKYSWFDADGNMVESRPESGGQWREYDSDEREETGVRVKVQPLRGARWKQHSTKSYYVDTRSGKRINPDAPSGKHILKESHFVFADGREFDYEGEKAKYDEHCNTGWRRNYISRPFDHEFRRTYHVNYSKPPGTPPTYPPDEREAAKTQLWYVSRTYQPWVEKHEQGPAPVTLEITDNIVKWEGELPDEVPDAMS